jgi:anti-sigma factor RsiW
LDVYGELDAAERSVFHRHLARCKACRDEHERVLRLLQRIREKIPDPILSPEKVGDMSLLVRKALEEKATIPRWKGLFDSPRKLIPALAAACIVVISVGWFSLRMFQGPPSEQRLINLAPENKLGPTDMEVISNLDLLQDLDVLNKLVQVVDGRRIL